MSLREKALAAHRDWRSRAEERDLIVHSERVAEFHRRISEVLECDVPPGHDTLEITIDGLTFRPGGTSSYGFWRPISVVTRCADCNQEVAYQISTLLTLGEMLENPSLCAGCDERKVGQA
jgi:hypothetical protein